jgi:hypothetical protein
MQKGGDPQGGLPVNEVLTAMMFSDCSRAGSVMYMYVSMADRRPGSATKQE